MHRIKHKSTRKLISLITISAGLFISTACSNNTDNENDTVSDDESDFPLSIPQTGVTESVRAGDDGDWQAGLEIPDARFFVQSNGTVLDTLTGLIWLKNLTCLPEAMTWENAINTTNNLYDDGMGTCGLSDNSAVGDWRLPNIRELQSLVFPGEQVPNNDLPFFNGLQPTYWSSTTKANDSAAAWLIRYGFIVSALKTGELHVVPVRDINANTNDVAAPEALIDLPKTGQAISYMVGDDGDWQAGIDWPEPRFKDNGDGTRTDLLTGLVWLVNPECNAAGSRWDNAIDSVNALAQDGTHTCDLTDGSIAGDWRMPNVLELHSMIDFGQDSPALPAGHPFDPVEQVHSTWTSTTLSSDAAYELQLGNGSVIEGDGFDFRFKVLAVR